MNEIEARGKIKYRIANEMRKAGENKEEYEDLEIALQLMKEIREYREIGTVEELQALKEKNEPKKPENIHCVKMQSFCEDDFGREIPCTIKSFQFYCPNCKRKIASRFKINNCTNCNQKLDWKGGATDEG